MRKISQVTLETYNKACPYGKKYQVYCARCSYRKGRKCQYPDQRYNHIVKEVV